MWSTAHKQNKNTFIFEMNETGIRDPRTNCPLNEQLMNSATRNLTRSRQKVQEFIMKEENVQRRERLQTIFTLTKLIADRFEGCKGSEVFGTEEYRQLCIPAFEEMNKQKHAGRKILFLSLSDPIMGLDTLHFCWFPTIRGTSASQLQLMVPFLDQLKGIKKEPGVGMKCEPQSLPSQSTAGENSFFSSTVNSEKNSKLTVRHSFLKYDMKQAIKATLKHHNVPFQSLIQLIDTADMPNEFVGKVNILVNFSLVTENVPNSNIALPADRIVNADNSDAIDDPVLIQANEPAVVLSDFDGSDFDDQVEEYNRSIRNKSINNNNDNSKFSGANIDIETTSTDYVPIAMSAPKRSDRTIGRIKKIDQISRILKRFEDPNYQSMVLGPLVPITNDNTSLKTADTKIYSDDVIMSAPSAESTPGKSKMTTLEDAFLSVPMTSPLLDISDPTMQPKEQGRNIRTAGHSTPIPTTTKVKMPKPNESLLHASNDSINATSIHGTPLVTPKLERMPRSQRIRRQQSLINQPLLRMAELKSEDDFEEIQPLTADRNQTAPCLRSSDEMLADRLIDYIDKKFEKLESSFSNKK